ncbi:uncharacterized protein [Oryza sativa Japonica Group]|uniref:Os12g0189900 protein n=2 Tax=Oryza sativa subsp. japonica TaxID=39947 RepID=A0A8J8Y8Q8_ORYSJ|nr:uncharacterized protein LOC4351697 isoform X1 [Oryza sativa Japonica Group]KAB8116857.1 hypothetical protein EE612_058221 [Oryza sativa]ABA96027.1 Las1-like family protein, expressed [Oryza sativa Japonica Group]EEE52888.1 hypothetical protein OsJ_35471 [Oryza sativa Japonica Group]BAF29356.1 Os12g0189900 [Oryza sativa Japonica Group]BAG89794.1 unnamed protein product [Oryza sativa Japonica Group]|eukprot:NP_001066337.1 Os12g0189900 [Oryza sativa Japonica Group]
MDAAAPEATGGFCGGGGGLSTGRKLVPWSSWAEWRHVRDGLFSASPAAALRRIAAWRSRGTLPVPVDVTAAFVEIRLRDPFFRSVMAVDDALESEEMLSMLYSMAIMRLVNGFVENPHKKTGYSISELAEAVGIPRVLVDIRHESSHRTLPSLRLLRLAAIKAFDWLKCIYWDSQTNAIPDVQVEVRSKLHEINNFMKGKDSMKAKSGSKRKRSEKMISRNIKYVRRLYYACPSEVAFVILDFFQRGAPESSENSDVLETDKDVDQSSDIHSEISNNDMRTIITKLSEKEPRLLLGILKSVIETIETMEDLENKGEYNASLPAKVELLSSHVLWLVTKLKELKDSGCIGVVHEIGVLSSDRNAVPRFCLAKLLRKLLSLSIIDERCIIDAALVLIEMATNNVQEKLRKLPMLSLGKVARDSTLPEPTKETESVEEATEKLEMFKSRLKQKDLRLAENDTGASLNTIMPEKRNRWSTAKSWTPCPIGMIPCSFSSVAVLPTLDVVDHESRDEILEQHVSVEPDDHTERIGYYSDPEKQLDAERIPELSRPSPEECEISDMPELAFPLKGRLLVGGVWKMVSEEELLFIKSKMKILL